MGEKKILFNIYWKDLYKELKGFILYLMEGILKRIWRFCSILYWMGFYEE